MMALEDVGGSMCESHLPRWAVAKPASISPTPPSLAGTRLPPGRNLVRVAAIPPYASISLVDHPAQQHIRVPRRLADEMQQRLVLGRGPIRAQPRRHRLQVLAPARQQKPSAIRSHRRHAIGMAKTARQSLDIAREPRFTAPVRPLKIPPRPLHLA